VFEREDGTREWCADGLTEGLYREEGEKGEVGVLGGLVGDFLWNISLAVDSIIAKRLLKMRVSFGDSSLLNAE